MMVVNTGKQNKHIINSSLTTWSWTCLNGMMYFKKCSGLSLEKLCYQTETGYTDKTKLKNINQNWKELIIIDDIIVWHSFCVVIWYLFLM